MLKLPGTYMSPFFNGLSRSKYVTNPAILIGVLVLILLPVTV